MRHPQRLPRRQIKALKNTQTDENMDNTYKTENKNKYNEDMTMNSLQ